VNEAPLFWGERAHRIFPFFAGGNAKNSVNSGILGPLAAAGVSAAERDIIKCAPHRCY
jgi:hypothetical protein